MTFDGLPPDLQRELRRIRVELECFPFVERTWHDEADAYAREGGYGAGRGARHARAIADDRFTEAAGGAPVFHEIQEGHGGTRSSVEQALRRFEGGGPLTAVVARAVDVAERRRAGDPVLSRPWLPIEAGDAVLETDDMRQRRLAREHRQRHRAATRAWVTRRAQHPERYGGGRPAPVASVSAEVVLRRSAAARKAWDTRRRQRAEVG